MRKLFEVSMSEGLWCAKNIENCLQEHNIGKVEVKELPVESDPEHYYPDCSKIKPTPEKIEKIICPYRNSDCCLEHKDCESVARRITQHILSSLPKEKKHNFDCPRSQGMGICNCGATDFNSCLSTIKKKWGIDD